VLNVAIGSAFRNATHHLSRYFHQVKALQSIYPSLRIIAVEGDSTDNTREALSASARSFDIPIDVITHNHGLPVFRSNEDPVRINALSGVCNAILDGVNEWDDIMVYVESDLEWDATTMDKLIHSMLDSDYHIVSPMVFAGDLFYDIWGFRKCGVRFTSGPPYHHLLNGERLNSIDSAGSCLVMGSSIVYSDDGKLVPRTITGALVEWCEHARAMGYKLAVDTSLSIHHPA